MSPRVECVLDIKAKLGECPVWCSRTDSLYWIDINAPSLNRFNPSTGENRAWTMPVPIGSFALCQDPATVLVALKSGLSRFDLGSGALTPLVAPERGHLSRGVTADQRVLVRVVHSWGLGAGG